MRRPGAADIAPYHCLAIAGTATLVALGKRTHTEETMLKRNLLLAGAMATALGLAGQSANAAEVFTLTSTTFKDGTMLPKKVANSTANVPTNPNCVGDNVSPQLSWTGVPDG